MHEDRHVPPYARIVDRLAAEVGNANTNGPCLSSVDSTDVDVCLSALGGVLAENADHSVGSNSIAFITPQGLVYPRGASDVEELSKASTTVLQKLEGAHGLFAAISAGLSSEEHPKASISAYFSEPDSHKLGMHVDVWDNIVLQIAGEKTFLFDEHPSANLKPGDILVLPQGLRHDVATTISSVHLSTVLLRRDWMESQGWS